MKKVVVICLLAFMINCQEKRDKLKREGEPDVMYFKNSDEEMGAAVKNAQETLSEFQKAIQSRNPNYSNFTLKKSLIHLMEGESIFGSGIFSLRMENIMG